MQNQEKLDELFNIVSMIGPLFKKTFTFAQSIDANDITKLAFNQKICLDLIHFSGEASMSFISTAMGISHQQVTRVVNDLVKLGLVDRKKDQNNKRIILAYETEKGKELHLKLHSCFKKNFYEYFKNYSAKEIDEIINHITALGKLFKLTETND